MDDKHQGEGNREADRRYRRGVRETAEQGKAKKRPASSEREI